MEKEPERFKTVKACIPFQGFMDKVDNYHVYEVFPKGTSELLGVFRYLKHARRFKRELEEAYE